MQILAFKIYTIYLRKFLIYMLLIYFKSYNV